MISLCQAAADAQGVRGTAAVQFGKVRATVGWRAGRADSQAPRRNIEEPTDPLIVLHDRIGIQLALGGKNAETWTASGWQVADHIEARFGTAAGRREARRARDLWKAIARERGARPLH